MSKQLDTHITCPSCGGVFNFSLYRSIWGEVPVNRELVMSDQINVATCIHCGVSTKLPFPFIYTNADLNFAVWWEPEYDPMINDDRADFARLMGASSYLATAPRVKDWNEFKNTILKFERGELQGSSPGKPTPEMEAHMKGFVEHLKKQNEEKREQAATEAKQRSRSGCLTSQSLLVVILLSVLSVSMLSCESETDRQDRLQREEAARIEQQERMERYDQERALRQEQERLERERIAEEQRIAREAEEERLRLEREEFERYGNNALQTGATPYSRCYGSNMSCSGWGCSEVTVRTPRGSDVIVTIKDRNERVASHAYIRTSSSYTFRVPNGRYQVFFYYGNGWNPNKEMTETYCGAIRGGFIRDEHFAKDSHEVLDNHVLQYDLVIQQGGNFSTQPSTLDQNF